MIVKITTVVVLLSSYVCRGEEPDTWEEDSCKIVFHDDRLDSTNTGEIVQACLEEFPVKDFSESERNTTEQTMFTTESTMSINVDNETNCALKCINENLNVTTSEGRLAISKLAEEFRNSNATEAYARKLTSLLDRCERKTVEKLQESGGFQNQLCKYHVIVMQCYKDAYMASRTHINKLCKPK